MPFSPPSTLNRPLTQFQRLFCGFVSRRQGAAKPEKFVSQQGGGLKPACSQDWLPHERPRSTASEARLKRQAEPRSFYAASRARSQ
jgi:hypothetical protein